MRIIDTLRRSAVAIAPEATIHDAATTMEQTAVGALAVVDGDRLVGIVTDRDLVRRALAQRMPLDARVDAVMTMPPVTVAADADLHDAYAAFAEHAIRRLAVVQGERFVGMVSIDDLLMDLADDLAHLVRPVTAEVLFGHHDSPLPVV